MYLAAYDSLVQTWYQWGHFAALALAAVVTFLVFYDAARRGIGATLWKALALAGLFLVLPSLVLWAIPSLSAGDLAVAIAPLAYVGLGASVLTLVSLIFYLAGAGKGTRRCPICGQLQHASWEYCPYCAQQQAAQAAAAPFSPPPSPAPLPPSFPAPPVQPPDFIAPIQPQPDKSAPPQVAKTELLGPVQSNELAWLVLLSGVHAGKEFRLGEATTIGRDPARNDVVIDDGAVSRQHAKVRLQDGQFVLYDLASTEGTLIKDRETGEWVETQKHVLVDGDQIKMGRETLGFMQIGQEPDEHE